MLRRVDSPTGAQIVGRSGSGDFAGIIIPYTWPGEERVRDYRLRRDHPDFERIPDGTLKERAKYLSPPGRTGMLYFAPGTAAELLRNADVPIVLTEGEFKTLALWRLAWHGTSDAVETPCFLPIGISGVWNWRGNTEKTYDADGVRVPVKGPIADLARVCWLGRRVVILFDADVVKKPDVAAAREQLTRELESRGAEVAWFQWPNDIPKKMKGIDDYLAECGPAEVLSLIARARVVTNRKKRAAFVETRSETSGQDWRGRLLITKNGEPKTLLANAITALRHAPEWTGVLAYNEFGLSVVMQKPAPWPNADPTLIWGDNEDRLTTDWLQREGIGVSVDVGGQAVQTVAMDRRFHPVRDYLDSLHWDGTRRLDSWLTTYLGVTGSDYASAVGTRWLSSIARVYCPSVKVDCCLILEGGQGLQKSTALRTIADPWFTDELSELGSKDAALQTCGVWVIELAELDATIRSDVSRIKAFMSRQTDRFRPPYGKRTIESPRQCVFAGTVNLNEYLRDETGARRFWPVRCTQIDIASLGRDRDQLWAEARDRFRNGEVWWLETPELDEKAREEQADRYQGDAWDDLIAEFIADKLTISVGRILQDAVNKKTESWTQVDSNRVARSLRAKGWERFRSSEPGRPWLYRRKKSVPVRPSTDEATEPS